MFGFTVRTRQNGPGSPRSGGSPGSVDSPGPSESPPRGWNSPRVDVGEIDTRAPFQSVKAAVSLFGDVGTPRDRPLAKRSKAEERVLEKETQHSMIRRELDYYKDQLRNAESAKAQASRQLQHANRTLQQLTNKLEILSESKQAAIKSTQEAKQRAKDLEEQKSLRAQLGNDAWKIDVDNERERYKASAAELSACKQELACVRQDFDTAIEAKLAAFQEEEEAQHVIKVNQEKQNQLSNKVSALREALDKMKLEYLQAQEEQAKLVAEKEARLLACKSAKEYADKEITRMKDESEPAENIEEKLEETTETIKVLQEQLNKVRASDLDSLKAVALELDSVRNALREVVAEESSIRSSVHSLELKLEEVKRERLDSEKKAVEVDANVERMQAELENTKSELEVAMFGGLESIHASFEKLTTEAEEAMLEAEEIKNNIILFKQEAEAARIATRESEEKLLIALKEVETAKAAEKLADEQIHDSPRTDAIDLKDSGSNRKIVLSIEEFNAMKKKIEDFKTEADVKVATAMARVDSINANEKEVLVKITALLKQNEDLQSEIADALKKAEMAEAAKQVVKAELRKWRQKEEGEGVGESSSSSISQEKRV